MGLVESSSFPVLGMLENAKYFLHAMESKTTVRPIEPWNDASPSTRTPARLTLTQDDLPQCCSPSCLHASPARSQGVSFSFSLISLIGSKRSSQGAEIRILQSRKRKQAQSIKSQRVLAGWTQGNLLNQGLGY